MTHNFEKLRIYQDTLSLAKRTYHNFKSFPCYPIRDQIIRSAISIPSNIAEGSQRNSNKDFIKFLRYGKGSASELFTQFRIIEDDPELDQIILRQLIEDSRLSMKQIQAFITHLGQ